MTNFLSSKFYAKVGRRWGFFLVAAALLLIVAPLVFNDFNLNLLAKFLTYAILALGLDLIWGYTGMLSLGQGVFFGLGAYSMAMYLKLEAAGNDLPDFMGLFGVNELPWFWQPFHNPIFAIVIAIALPMLLAGLLGFLVFRSRIQGVYFSLITQALALILVTLFTGAQPVTGGTSGLSNFTTIFGFSLNSPGVKLALYFITVVCLGGTFLLSRWLVGSRYGRVLVAIREDENRVRFMGYNPTTLKILIFTFAAGLAGLAGMLFVLQVGLISPAAMGIVPSIEMVIWVAVGGRGTLAGAVIGAVLVNYGKSSISGAFPDFWQYFYGALFIGVVLFFPTGLVGSWRSLGSKLQSRFFTGVAASPKLASASASESQKSAVDGGEVAEMPS
jgi:urea transport system permease protein